MRIDAISPNLPDAGISKIADLTQTGAPNQQIGAEGTEATGKTFGQLLQDAIGEVNQAQTKAGELTQRFAAGEAVDIHQVEIAGQEANVMLNLTMQVRNKLVDAYTEIMHTSV
jgi:flagellar hook-basal body complex protein FliE